MLPALHLHAKPYIETICCVKNTPGLRKHKSNCSCRKCKNTSYCFAHFGLKNHECLFSRQLLAKDVASKVHCDMYRRCHEGRHIFNTTRISEQPHSSECRKAGAPQLGVIQWPLWDVKIGFDDVQQVMRRQTWNTPYGASLESIAVDKDWQAVRMNSHNILGKWFLEFDLQLKIISGILVLHTCHRLFFGKELFARVVGDRQSANGKLVADIVKGDFQICQGEPCEYFSDNSDRLHKIIEHRITTYVSKPDPRLEHRLLMTFSFCSIK